MTTASNPTAVATGPYDEAIDLAVESLYRFLAAVLSDPSSPGGATVCDPASRQIVQDAADLLREEFGDEPLPLGFGELPVDQLNARPLLAELARPKSELREEYVRTFGFIMNRECPPYETEFHQIEDTFFRSQQMADIAGFYRAFGLEPGSPARERPDHIALELEFVAFLLLKKRLAAAEGRDDPCELDRAATCHEGRVAFVRDHLSWWASSYAQALRRYSERGLYAAAGALLSALLPVDRRRLGVAAPTTPLEARVAETSEDCSGCLVSLSTQ